MTIATRHQRNAFSLAEAMVGMTIMALAGSALLLAVETSLHTTISSEDETIAAGLAEQLVDEIMGHHYASPTTGDPFETPLGPSTTEAAGNGRELFNDSDDFNGYTAQPAEDTWGIELGHGDAAGGNRHPNFQLRNGRFSRWKQTASVYYVNDDMPWVKLTGSTTSSTRCVEVNILQATTDGQWLTLATAKRVYTYVPTPP